MSEKPKQPRGRPGANPWPARLRKLRARLGSIRPVTQARIAKAIGVTTRTWLNWEKGDIVPPKTIHLLIKQLEAHPEDFGFSD